MFLARAAVPVVTISVITELKLLLFAQGPVVATNNNSYSLHGRLQLMMSQTSQDDDIVVDRCVRHQSSHWDPRRKVMADVNGLTGSWPVVPNLIGSWVVLQAQGHQ